MRKIVFRGKRVDNGEWVYGDIAHIEDRVFVSYYHNCELKQFINDEVTYNNITLVGVFPFVEVIPETVGQYVTGLNDKKGNEVFEGDIVEFLSVDLSNPRIIATIKYGEYKNQPLCEGCNYSDWHLGFYMQTVNGQGAILLGSSEETSIRNIGEVIGNIHDNPKFLEVNK